MSDRLPKPPHGSPCNRCGQCCEESLCPLGARLFGRDLGPCPALLYEGNLSVCGLVAAPARFARVRAARLGPTALSQAAAVLTGSGMGCDAKLSDGEAVDWSFRKKMVAWADTHASEVKAALRAWGFGKNGGNL